MVKKQNYIVLVFLISLSTIAFALESNIIDETADPTIFGYEIEKLLNFGSGIVALILFITTLFAYKRSRNKRLVFVNVAFFLFAIKGFLTSLELFGLELYWVDPTASVLNFAILMSFFFGVVRK